MVSIIIVNYNSGDLLRACLESLRKFVTVPYEVIVVDNASSDGSLDELPSVSGLQVIRSDENLGFPRACNLGAASATGRVFHFLNPDAEVTENINEAYALALNETEPQIYVTRILNTRAGTERSCHPFPTLSNVLRLVLFQSSFGRWFVGASVILSQSLFERLGRWSIDYFMYYEDVDLFYKAHLANIKTVQTESLVVHHQGGSSRKVWTDRQRLEKIERSAFIFARKFGIGFDYFVFKHAAFFKVFWRQPTGAVLELRVFWRELLRSSLQLTDR